jgi:choline dehydrogenase-like flavoprotein
MFDYLLVGCGLFNATFARHALDAGKKVLVVDRRPHIAGNCYDERRQGINTHIYGPHQFHTRNRAIWDFVNRFTEFNHYRAHIKGTVGRRFVFHAAQHDALPPVVGGHDARPGAEADRGESGAVRAPCQSQGDGGGRGG